MFMAIFDIINQLEFFEFTAYEVMDEVKLEE